MPFPVAGQAPWLCPDYANWPVCTSSIWAMRNLYSAASNRESTYHCWGSAAQRMWGSTHHLFLHTWGKHVRGMYGLQCPTPMLWLLNAYTDNQIQELVKHSPTSDHHELGKLPALDGEHPSNLLSRHVNKSCKSFTPLSRWCDVSDMWAPKVSGDAHNQNKDADHPSLDHLSQSTKSKAQKIRSKQMLITFSTYSLILASETDSR